VSFADDFERAGERLLAAHPEIETGTMFASFGYSIGRKYFAFDHKGTLVLKLPAARVQELIAGGAGEPFSSGGRVMREWVTTHPHDADECFALMDKARAFVASLPAKR
jgi:hypothetical protein